MPTYKKVVSGAAQKTTKNKKKSIKIKPAKKTILKKLPKIKTLVAPDAASPSPKSFIGSKGAYLSNKELLAELKVCKASDVMSDKLARMLQLLCGRFGKKGNFANYCVDADTRALTQTGWKYYNQITTADKILSYNPESKTLVWSAIKGIYINSNYNGTMHKLDTQGMDALVTPNHKFVSVERGIIPVEDIICDEHIVLTGLPVSDSNPATYTNSFIEVVGWAITKGHYIKGSTRKRCISISQKEGQQADRIRQCLQESGITYREYSWKEDLVIFNCTGDKISSIYDSIAPNRVLSEDFILSLTQSQRLLLIETMINADGWYIPNGEMSYVQKDPNHADAFLMLCTIAGLTTLTTSMVYKTPISGKNPTGGESNVLSINIYAQPKLQCKAEHIDFHGGMPGPGGKREQKANSPTQQYKGTIWCPQTEYGTFVCRRNKYIYVTGNTYNDDMQAYAMLMLVRTWRSFDPKRSDNPFAFFTQCIKNSFKQYLNQEKRQRVIRDVILVDMGLTPSFNYLDSAVASDDINDMESAPAAYVDDNQDHGLFEKELNHLENQTEFPIDDLSESIEGEVPICLDENESQEEGIDEECKENDDTK
jgi:hypothetical protein